MPSAAWKPCYLHQSNRGSNGDAPARIAPAQRLMTRHLRSAMSAIGSALPSTRAPDSTDAQRLADAIDIAAERAFRVIDILRRSEQLQIGAGACHRDRWRSAYRNRCATPSLRTPNLALRTAWRTWRQRAWRSEDASAAWRPFHSMRWSRCASDAAPDRSEMLSHRTCRRNPCRRLAR